MKRGALLLICTLFLLKGFSQIVMVGPMIHLNFEGKKIKPSYALEASYWWLNKFPVGVDAAFEFQKGKFRIYSEAQTGIGVAGISAGPFVEWAKGSRAKGGLQLTGWINYYIGADVRARFYKGPDTFAAGVYAKIPAFIGEELKDDEDSEWWDWDD